MRKFLKVSALVYLLKTSQKQILKKKSQKQKSQKQNRCQGCQGCQKHEQISKHEQILKSRRPGVLTL